MEPFTAIIPDGSFALVASRSKTFGKNIFRNHKLYLHNHVRGR
jgi:hypothetical protein